MKKSQENLVIAHFRDNETMQITRFMVDVYIQHNRISSYVEDGKTFTVDEDGNVQEEC